MRRSLIALALSGLLGLPAAPVAAQTPSGETCWFARAPARAALAQAYQFSPAGYGPFGYAPLLQPFGAEPWGAPILFGPPGPLPTYGPLGPGLTANTIAAFAQANGGIDNDLLLDLASQQQSELLT
jgi:hypothetical protein